MLLNNPRSETWKYYKYAQAKEPDDDLQHGTQVQILTFEGLRRRRCKRKESFSISEISWDGSSGLRDLTVLNGEASILQVCP